MSDFKIWTDGGCAPTNPGIGGYGIILVDNTSQEKREIKQGFERSTNNRMELRAVIRALEEIPKGASVTLYTDSTYVVNHVKGNEKKNNNADLWKLFEEAMEGRNRDDVEINWVKGEKIEKNIKDELHENNYRCDRMVHEARENNDALIVDEGYEPYLDREADNISGRSGKKNMEDKPTLNTIFNTFAKMGYTDITMNLWHGVRLYVNIKGEQSFCYVLDELYKRKRYGSRILSKEPLRGGLFTDAQKLCRFVYNKRTELAKEMEEGVYYTA